jgi:hypothetical protein
MSTLRIFTLVHDEARRRCAEFARQAAAGVEVVFKEPKRTSDQNALLWSWLTCFSEQLLWPVNGERVRMTSDEWKDVLTAAFRREHLRIAQGLDGGVVLLGMRTSDMGKKQFAEFIDFIEATAAMRGVQATWLGTARPQQEPTNV